MSNIAIRAQNLSKVYYISNLHPRNDTLRDALAGGFSHALSRFRRNGSNSGDDTQAMWALKDVSFEIKIGEVIGIIGRNGAGKSTLLKILSRITEPTKGRIEIQGRVGSLLEVGTGFHPDLSGRENIFLNGAVLGMKRTEIARKFDEIVAFAEVEKFIDVPVKRYSSGMYVRLAFAVAAHLEPEILLVDEVLAVGDVGFQEKCLGKMGTFAQEGRTVLFVSHSMPSVARLTKTGIWLDGGEIRFWGPVHQAIEKYRDLFVQGKSKEFNPRGRTGHGESRIENIVLLDSDEQPITEVSFGKPFIIRTFYRTSRKQGVLTGFAVRASDGTAVLGSNCNDMDSSMRLTGEGVVDCIVDPNLLAPGNYHFQCGLFLDAKTYEMDDRIERALDFEVILNRELEYKGMANERIGVVRVPYRWVRK